MTDWMYDCERLIYAPLNHWQWLFQCSLTCDMWTEDYYQLLSIIGDDFE